MCEELKFAPVRTSKAGSYGRSMGATESSPSARGPIFVIGVKMTGETAEKPVWHRGRTCESGACVEIASVVGAIMVRSSLNPEGAAVILTRKEWEEFLDGVKEGTFDHI